VLGCLLLDWTSWPKVAEVLRPQDFYRPDHRVIFGAMSTLAIQGKAADVVTLSDHLERFEQLKDAGGIAYLGTLFRETASASNIGDYAAIVKEKAQLRGLEELAHQVAKAAADGANAADIAADLHARIDRLIDAERPAPRIQLRHVADIVSEYREPTWLVPDILERNVMAVLAGKRGTFKSFVGLHWLLGAAVNGAQVLILSAEGAGLDRRVDAWMRTHAPGHDLRDLSVTALEAAINLNDATTLKGLRALIRDYGLKPDAVMIDTYSKYAPGLDENDNAAVASHLSAINDGLRTEFGSTVLLVAHAGHGDARRPRGASALMANPDAEFIVERPDIQAMVATVTRERFKDSAALPPLAYRAELVDLGRQDRRGNHIRSLVMVEAEATVAVRPAISGKNQKRLLAELERLSGEPGCIGIWTEGELRKIGRDLGMGKQSASDAVHGLRALGYLVQTVGGCRLEHVPGQKVRNGAESQNSDRDVRAEREEGSVRPLLSARPSAPPEGLA
jgi:hypothetical protein